MGANCKPGTVTSKPVPFMVAPSPKRDSASAISRPGTTQSSVSRKETFSILAVSRAARARPMVTPMMENPP